VADVALFMITINALQSEMQLRLASRNDPRFISKITMTSWPVKTAMTNHIFNSNWMFVIDPSPLSKHSLIFNALLLLRVRFI